MGRVVRRVLHCVVVSIWFFVLGLVLGLGLGLGLRGRVLG